MTIADLSQLDPRDQDRRSDVRCRSRAATRPSRSRSRTRRPSTRSRSRASATTSTATSTARGRCDVPFSRSLPGASYDCCLRRRRLRQRRQHAHGRRHRLGHRRRRQPGLRRRRRGRDDHEHAQLDRGDEVGDADLAPGAGRERDLRRRRCRTPRRWTRSRSRASRDDVYGNLDGKGSCDVPQTIAPAAATAAPSRVRSAATPAASHTDVVTASGTDDDGNPVSDDDDAVVTITNTAELDRGDEDGDADDAAGAGRQRHVRREGREHLGGRLGHDHEPERRRLRQPGRQGHLRRAADDRGRGCELQLLLHRRGHRQRRQLAHRRRHRLRHRRRRQPGLRRRRRGRDDHGRRQLDRGDEDGDADDAARSRAAPRPST